MNSKYFKITFVLLAFALTVFPTDTPVHTATNQQVNITFWWTEGTVEGSLYKTLIAGFEKANPNINVTSVQVGYFDNPTQYNNAFLAGTAPDVMRADVTWITTWANDGKLVVLNKTDITNYNDFTPESLEKVYWKGNMYGIPQVVDSLGVFYNKHIFSAAGITVPTNGFSFDQFTAAGKTLKSWVTNNYIANLTASQFYPFNMQGYSYAFLPIMFGFGAQYFKDNNLTQSNMDFNTTQWTNALNFLKSILPGGADAMTPPVSDQGWGNIDTYFENGRVAMIFQGPWAVAGYLQDAPMFNKTAYQHVYGSTAPNWVGPDNMGFMKVPYNVINGITYQGMYSGGHAYVVSTESKNIAASVKLADFLASPDADYLRSEYNHLISPRKSTYTSDYNTTDNYVPSQDPIVSGFRLNLNSGITRPIHPYWIPVDNVVAPILENFRSDSQYGNYTAAQAQSDMMNQVGALLETLPVLVGGAGFTTERTATPGFELYILIPALIMIGLVASKKRKLN